MTIEVMHLQYVDDTLHFCSGINPSFDEIDFHVSILGGKVESFPFNFLGFPVEGKHGAKVVREALEEAFKLIDKWRGLVLSKGDRITLAQLVPVNWPPTLSIGNGPVSKLFTGGLKLVFITRRTPFEGMSLVNIDDWMEDDLDDGSFRTKERLFGDVLLVCLCGVLGDGISSTAPKFGSRHRASSIGFQSERHRLKRNWVRQS
ncbi:hypothetical protein E5676_scaffold132G00090 [Cucumis melo var. makuwa]|uniref:Uncharacterized protein n=1 Tax=Cucumis melo var. makuwa TaxID=1194695 RepID=A0A5D3DAK4_CUCMM|nr:hypothetical protein E5676_scaffold132G00090 [Cucumis melo var. makuwa]